MPDIQSISAIILMKYFTISELSHSATAENRGIKNVPNSEEVIALNNLIDTVLDPLRISYGKPIKVNSGYRCLQLNRLLGSKDSSHHRRGMAADISGGGKKENELLFNLVRSMGLPFTQLINEYGFSWVHISLDPEDVRMQVVNIN